MGEATGGQEATPETLQPFDTAIGAGSWGYYTKMTYPSQAVGVVLGIGDVQPAVDNHFIPKSGAGIYPCNPCSPSGTVVKHGGFDTADLQGVRNFLCPIRYVAITHRSEEHTSDLQSLMRISYAVFCLK